MAFRRNAGHGSLATTLSAVDLDFARQTLVSWELLLASNIQAQACAFRHTQYEMLRRSGQGLTWEIHATKSDSTNTNATSSHKAYCAEVVSIFYQDAELPPVEGARELRSYPDVLPVAKPCGAVGCRAMVIKQLQSIGVIPWHLDWRDVDGHGIPENLLHRRHIRVFFFGSDAGGEESGNGQDLDREMADDPSTFNFRNYCYKHQAQLMVVRQLKHLGSYWSSLAKVANCLRSPNGSTDMYNTYARLVSQARADVCAISLPARPLRGRWDAVTHSETKLLLCWRHELPQVFRSAMTRHCNRLKSATEWWSLELDQSEDDSSQLGRWASEAVAALESDAFFGCNSL